tara:strand:- start:509 stop:1147 length:639 start_codon:yes stop_codon:yes gene_type:complete
MLSYAKHVHLHCGNFEPSFDARWEADTAYRLRCINEVGAIGLESFSGKWVWLNVYAGNRLLDAGELGKLNIPKISSDELEKKQSPRVQIFTDMCNEVLDTLSEREREVLEQRFGLKDGYTRTLEEVGRQLEVTRERIRQIEAKAFRKLRHPSRIRKLKDFIKLPEEPEKSASSDSDSASEEASTLMSEHEADVLGGLEDLLKEFGDDKNADE